MTVLHKKRTNPDGCLTLSMQMKQLVRQPDRGCLVAYPEIVIDQMKSYCRVVGPLFSSGFPMRDGLLVLTLLLHKHAQVVLCSRKGWRASHHFLQFMNCVRLVAQARQAKSQIVMSSLRSGIDFEGGAECRRSLAKGTKLVLCNPNPG